MSTGEHGADGSRRYGRRVEPKRRSEVSGRIAPLAEAVARAVPVLDEVAVAISTMLQPDLDPLTVMTDLDDLASSCPSPTRDGVIGHLFGTGRLIGDRRDYHGWRNSCIDHVLGSGRGMPITLSVIAIEVARRLGVHLVPIGMPGHFLVGDATDDHWFADPYHGRTSLGRVDCRAVFASIHGESAAATRWSDTFVRPIAARHVAARMLNNLKVSCERSEDRLRLAVVMQARTLLPELGDDPRDVAPALAVFN
ncbi:MAG: hypothetical protein RLZZ01_1460 [Actinomycetota bacterium]